MKDGKLRKMCISFFCREFVGLAMTSALAIYSHHHLAFLHYQRCRFHRLWGSSWSCCRSPPPPSSPPVVGIGLVTLLMVMVMMMVMFTSLGRVRGVEVVVGVVGVVQGRLPTYLGLFRRTTKTRKAWCLNIRIIIIPIILESHLTPQQPTPSSRLFSPSSSSSTCGSKA